MLPQADDYAKLHVRQEGACLGFPYGCMCIGSHQSQQLPGSRCWQCCWAGSNSLAEDTLPCQTTASVQS